MCLIGDVINVRDYPRGLLPVDAIYVGRPSPWGNPFIIGRHGDRATVIRLYRKRLWGILRDHPDYLAPLVGKHLACHCAPQPCHADVLIAAILWRYGGSSTIALGGC